MPYKFKLNLTYNLESDNEDDAITEVVDLIKRDWPYYVDEGDLVEVRGKRKKTVMRSRSRGKHKSQPTIERVMEKWDTPQ